MFRLELQIPHRLDISPDCRNPSDYSSELDGIQSVLTDLCDVLAENVHVRFVVHAFDEQDWKASVRTDLAVALEQIPDVLEGLAASDPVDLDFYEQGLERTLHFEGKSAELLVTCRSNRPSWRPNAGSIQMARSEVVAMIRALAETFLRAATQTCPELAAHPWLAKWALDCGLPPPR